MPTLKRGMFLVLNQQEPAMSEMMIPKYPTEFLLEFRSADRFLYRISDLRDLSDLPYQNFLERLDNCHIYLLGKRPRLSVAPASIQATAEAVRFNVEYKLAGAICQAAINLPRSTMVFGYRLTVAANLNHDLSESGSTTGLLTFEAPTVAPRLGLAR
jgi:hypothetical protein